MTVLILSYLLTTFSTVFCKTAGRNPVPTRPVLIGYTNKILKGSEALNDSNTATFLKQFTLCQSHIRGICKVIQCISFVYGKYVEDLYCCLLIYKYLYHNLKNRKIRLAVWLWVYEGG